MIEKLNLVVISQGKRFNCNVQPQTQTIQQIKAEVLKDKDPAKFYVRLPNGEKVSQADEEKPVCFFESITNLSHLRITSTELSVSDKIELMLGVGGLVIGGTALLKYYMRNRQPDWDKINSLDPEYGPLIQSQLEK